MKEREYQYNYSESAPKMYDEDGRTRKAATMVAVFRDVIGDNLRNLSLLNVGGSSGYIDDYLSAHFGQVTGMDIDETAIEFAASNFVKGNLRFEVGDAMDMPYEDAVFDVVVCSQVYEHVPDAHMMFQEIFRVLRPGGYCYFAATNRIMFNEPHYDLPLLSLLPRWLADVYVRLTGKAEKYHEYHFTYWGLKRLVSDFQIVDYTREVIDKTDKYKTDYMLPDGSVKKKVASVITRFFYWASPGYIWVLKKPD